MASDMDVEGMPIRQVTLYDNGFAVFQREKTIQGHGSIDLYFSHEHMKSVLESLQFLGDASSKVGNIAYEVTKPVASIDLREQEPLVGLIRSLIGRLMSITVQESENEETFEGRVLGVESRIFEAVSDNATIHVSILLDGGKMRMFPIMSIKSFHILETQVQEDLAFSLDLKRMSGNEYMQKLSVFYSNIDSPQVLIARYGFQVTEFESSYRMKLSDDPTHFQLDGLAIVENTLDEDWNDISLKLVVGAPPLDGFDDDDDDDEGVWELKIKDLSGEYFNVQANPKDSVLKLKGLIGKETDISPSAFKLMFAGKAVEEGRCLSDYTIGNNATLIMSSTSSTKGIQNRHGSATQSQFVMAAQDNLSFYQIPMHVTAKRKQKAIVPLLQAQLEGQKVYLYDESIRTGNPLCALLFENTTGRTLEGGSLQISSSEMFLGQGTLPTIHPGDESPPIPFAVELACEVTKGVDSTHLNPHHMCIENGTATVTRIHREISLYRIKNKSDKEMDFLLNHLFLEDYDLVQIPDKEEEEPVDITDRFYQFRFVVPPHIEKKTFIVREETNEMKEYPIRDIDEELLVKWVRGKLVNSKTERAIRDTFIIKKQISDIQRGIYEKESEVREVQSTQEHLRSNISALEGHEKEAAKYVHSLADEEDKLKSLQDSIKAARQQKKKLETKLSANIELIQFKKELPKSTANKRR